MLLEAGQEGLEETLIAKTAVCRLVTSTPDPERLTLHDAMVAVLEDLAGGPAPGRRVATEVVRRGLYVRLVGGRPDYQQILARAKKNPQLFEVGAAGPSLPRGGRGRRR